MRPLKSVKARRLNTIASAVNRNVFSHFCDNPPTPNIPTTFDKSNFQNCPEIHDWTFTVTFQHDPTVTVEVSGVCNYHANVIPLNVYFGNTPMDTKTRHELFHYLRYVVRHELEHAQQYSRNKLLFDYIDPLYDAYDRHDYPKYWQTYLSAPAEIEAYAVSLYQRACKIRTPYHTQIQSFIDAFSDTLRKQALNPQLAQEILQHAQHELLQLGRRRFSKHATRTHCAIQKPHNNPTHSTIRQLLDTLTQYFVPTQLTSHTHPPTTP